MRRSPELILPLALVCAGCIEIPPPGTNPPPPLPDACTMTTDLEPGVTSDLLSFEHGGGDRNFIIHLPAGYTGEEPLPIVFASHGLAQGPNMMIAGSDFVPKADAEGFVVVFPDGEGNAWNAGDCCGGADDDVDYFRAMLEHVRRDLGVCVDRTRVYATGLSNGGFMSYRLACEASDLFAAVAPVAGALVISKEACEAAIERPVPVLAIHGTSDAIVQYDYAATGMSAVRSVEEFADINGCDAATVQAAQPTSMLDTDCITYTGCDEGAEVTFCSVDDGGHCWFGNDTCGTGVAGGGIFVGNDAEGIVAVDAVWDFFSRFACEDCGL
jgi:polyhydroxybutyrate depolymerase